MSLNLMGAYQVGFIYGIVVTLRGGYQPIYLGSFKFELAVEYSGAPKNGR